MNQLQVSIFEARAKMEQSLEMKRNLERIIE